MNILAKMVIGIKIWTKPVSKNPGCRVEQTDSHYVLDR